MLPPSLAAAERRVPHLREPDLIFLAETTCCGQNADPLGMRPGWSGIKAVGKGDIVLLDDDIASRWGPRIVSYIRTVAAHVGAVK
jgi:iron complex transport system substrate-binding protein